MEVSPQQLDPRLFTHMFNADMTLSADYYQEGGHPRCYIGGGTPFRTPHFDSRSGGATNIVTLQLIQTFFHVTLEVTAASFQNCKKRTSLSFLLLFF